MNTAGINKYVFVFAFFMTAVFSFAQNIRVVGVIPKGDTGKSYQLQVGAFRITSNADSAAAVLTRTGFSPMREKSGGLLRVFVVVPAAEVHSAVERLGRAGFREVVIREYISAPPVPPVPKTPVPPVPAGPKTPEPEVVEPAPPESVPEAVVPPVEEIPEEPVIEEVTKAPPIIEYENFVFESEEPEHDLVHIY